MSKITQKIFEKETYPLSLGSIVYMDMLVATGELTATMFDGKSAHDSAASKIIIEEAGGKFTDILGSEQRYDRDVNGHVASNGILHEELIDIIKTNL